MRTLIADSGTTKTEWLYFDPDDPQGQQTFRTDGLNPHYATAVEITNVARSLGLAPDRVYFYGAGCTPDTVPTVHDALAAAFPAADIAVASDILGAARALFGPEGRGVACIIGTGSIAAFVDMRHDQINVWPSMGYILGDEGSGCYIGRHLLSDYCKGIMPPPIARRLEEYCPGLSPADIIDHTYHQPFPSRYLASFAPFIVTCATGMYGHRLAGAAFREFFRRNVDPLFRSIVDGEALVDARRGIRCVGSIAVAFRQQIEEIAATRGYTIGKVVRSPLPGLAAYHGLPVAPIQSLASPAYHGLPVAPIQS